MIQLIWVVSLSVFWSNQQWLSRFQCLTEPDRWIDQSFSSFVSHFVWGFHTGPLRYFPKIHGRPTLFFWWTKDVSIITTDQPTQPGWSPSQKHNFSRLNFLGSSMVQNLAFVLCKKHVRRTNDASYISIYDTHIYVYDIYILLLLYLAMALWRVATDSNMKSRQLSVPIPIPKRPFQGAIIQWTVRSIGTMYCWVIWYLEATKELVRPM